MKKTTLAAALFAIVALTVAQAGASVVFNFSGGTYQPMPAINYFGPGPQTFGVGNTITWSSTNAFNQGGSVFGYNGGYGFSGNGFWDGFEQGSPMAGLNDSFDVYGVTDTMTFAFATPVSSVGGFINYVPFGSTPTTIAVYNAAHQLIESYNLTFVVGSGCTDCGMLIGFQEATADISYFTLTDNYIGISDLTTNFGSNNGVPEPSSLILFGSGAAGLLGIVRRKLSR